MGKIFININKGDVEMSANVTNSELVIATGTLIHEMIFHLNKEYGMEEEIKKVLCDNINSEELDADKLNDEMYSRVVSVSTSGHANERIEKIIDEIQKEGGDLVSTFLDFLGEKYGE